VAVTLPFPSFRSVAVSGVGQTERGSSAHVVTQLGEIPQFGKTIPRCRHNISLSNFRKTPDARFQIAGFQIERFQIEPCLSSLSGYSGPPGRTV